MDTDEIFEIMKRSEEIISKNNRVTLKNNNGRCLLVKDASQGYVFGEVEYGEGSFYHLKSEDKRPTLFYSDLEKVFINNKTH